jgi:maltooligosyltrehalose synthase
VPAGTWRDMLGERELTADGSGTALADLLAERPVALLVRQ